MDFFDLIWHLAGLAAPALFVAVIVVLLPWMLGKNRFSARVLLARAAVNFLVCALVLVGGLVLLGQDGRMLTYALLVLASATMALWRRRLD
ncbi:MAG: hypothetical protein Q4G70_04370 [Pseudomonadota bacterium]|nr:hypothetical protein [Pseudomonadota bacterium]